MRISLRLITVCFISVVCVPSMAGARDGSLPEETVEVVMQGRAFMPARTIVHQHRRTRLVFWNQDSELHAFAPTNLFTGVSFHVAGNGAPEFGPDGLKRVIVPAEGRAEIHFTPANPGEYRYLCDMPGHEMNGIIVVE
ncbi:MAG: cupredoxin domain-containing protein [Nitrospiraceae bacterium]|nr:cupredoxin domain-containing protein [Nitrospiraceae bacterium]